MNRDYLLTEIKTRLGIAFGPRFQGLVLYGSQARQKADADSDIDLLVLLATPISLGKDLKAIIDALYPLQLEIEKPIHALPVEASAFEAAEFPLYRCAKMEGMLV